MTCKGKLLVLHMPCPVVSCLWCKLWHVSVQDIPKLGRVLHNSVTHVAEHEVQLSDGSSVPFDFLVLATGSTWTDPVCSGTEEFLNDRRQAQMVILIILLRCTSCRITIFRLVSSTAVGR